MSKLKKALNAGKFTITTEIGPPKGVSVEDILEELELVRGRVDGINVTDQQSSVMRLGSIATSKLLLENGFEPICQITCRDRNRIALQSDILSAYVLGIRNIVAMTGDHPLLGDHPQAKPVYDLDSVNLLGAIKILQSGEDISGKKLNASPEFFVGAVVNPGADPLEPEIIKLEKKVASGAEFVQTQAIFDPIVFKNFMSKIKHLRSKVKILGGVVPLRSAKMAKYMNANIPGVMISPEIIEKLENAKDIEAISTSISAGIVSAIKDSCDGIHFMPIRANYLVVKILDKLEI